MVGKVVMRMLVAGVVALTSSPVYADSMQTLPAPSSAAGKPPVGIVAIQGAQIPAAAYVPLMQAVQNAVADTYAVYVAIPAYLGDLPEPVQFGSGVSSALKALQKMMPKSGPTVLFAHSLGAVFAQDYAAKNKDKFAFQILTGAGLARKYRTGAGGSLEYDVPTLTLDGTLDGLYRVTRQAEGYYHQFLHPAALKDAGRNFPIVIYEGVTHMQFASGKPPSNVQKNDLKPEVTYEAAHAMMASSIADYMKTQIGGISEAVASDAATRIGREVSDTGSLLQPLIDAMEQEAYHHFLPACNSDYPMPECPAYPRYPSGPKGTTPQANCTCGTPFSATAQQIMGGDLPSGVSIASVDAIHAVSDINPIHLPHIWHNCTGSRDEKECEVNVTTVTQAIYNSLDGLDTGFYYQTASELRVKLKSRQSLLLAAGVPASQVHFNDTDVTPSLCAKINDASYTWAKSKAGSAASSRFNNIGQPFTFGKDIFLSNAGPAWIYNPLKYSTAADKSNVVVSAPCSHTPVDYSIKSAAGYHYCKVLSPARAMEWIYIDGLRAKGGL